MADAPVCAWCRKQPADPKYRPFCSARCKLADLGRWLNEDYRIPDREPDTPPDPPYGRDADDH
jgi:endogenous inhibitor of DNA gyrase (YacG/DUF329 family)